MQDHLDDAILRYDFARQNLAAVDTRIQAARLDSHVKGAITLSVAQHHQAADLLDKQAELSEKFAQTAIALSTSLRSAADEEASA
jgi:hypothetical protein